MISCDSAVGNPIWVFMERMDLAAGSGNPSSSAS